MGINHSTGVENRPDQALQHHHYDPMERAYSAVRLAHIHRGAPELERFSQVVRQVKWDVDSKFCEMVRYYAVKRKSKSKITIKNR